MNKLPLLVGIAVLQTAIAAQSVVVPNGMAQSNTGTSTFVWRNTEFHFQMLYDPQHFLAQGVNYPITISRLQFRAAGGATSTGGETYNGVTVQMSSSPSDWSNPSTTFATNRGADNTVVFTGTVVAAAAQGLPSPNTYIIDIPLTTPFSYDPMGGTNLLIEVDAPAPIPTGVPSIATSSNAAAHMARRISAGTQAATTGTLSDFAAVVLMDYTPLANAATATPYGRGCMDLALTFYEELLAGTFDLQGTAGNPNSIRMTPVGGGYGVTVGSNTWFTPVATPLTLGDDELAPPTTLPFTFNFPGGSTTAIQICSNGFIYLDTTSTSTTSVGDGALLVSGGPRHAPLWIDIDPSVGGTVTYDVDPSNTAVYVTWDQVPRFGIPTELNTFQLALFGNGDVEYRWQVCQNGDGLVGFSPGNGARDRGSMDLSASLPFTTAPDNFPLRLEPITRPRINSTFDAELQNVPANATLGAVFFGFTQLVPPVALGIIGMPTCFQHASVDVTFSLTINGTSAPFTINVPNDPNLVGNHLYMQGIADGAGQNPLGVVTSNGLDLLFDVN